MELVGPQKCLFSCLQFHQLPLFQGDKDTPTCDPQ